jgi:hypothetical protein
MVFNIYIAAIALAITFALLLIERSEPGFLHGIVTLIINILKYIR